MGDRIDLEELAARIDDRFPRLSERGRRVALGVHRTLAYGEPVPEYAVAALTGLDISEVHEEMEGWPGIYRDEGGRIVGFWGLALRETDHRFVVEGRELFTWCAWDALFLPELLGLAAEARSTCAATRAPIRLSVGPDGIRDADPPGIALSFVDPDGADVDGDAVVSTFCHHILFFSTRALARAWVEARGEGTFVLGLDEAVELGRLCNALRYGAALTDPPQDAAAAPHPGS